MLIETLAVLALLSGPQEYAPGRADGPQRVAPRGDYARSCSGSYVNQGRLYADCQDRRGNLRGTSIELARCADDEIRNDDGLLVCGRFRGDYETRPGGGGGNGNPGWPGGGGGNNGNNGGGWGGGWGGGRGAITVYRDANFRGVSAQFDREMPNLANTGFNDSISSIRLRGTWELCTDAYFRGDCRVFTEDSWNLQAQRLNDHVSSMRPVRR